MSEAQKENTFVDKYGVARHRLSSSEGERGRAAAHEAKSRASKVLGNVRRKADLTGEKRKIIEDTTEKLKGLMFDEEVTYSELAKRLEMSQGHISHMMCGTRNMTLGSLSAIGEALGYRFTIVAHKIDD